MVVLVFSSDISKLTASIRRIGLVDLCLSVQEDGVWVGSHGTT